MTSTGQDRREGEEEAGPPLSTPSSGPSSGDISIGVMTGGAVASGPGAQAVHSGGPLSPDAAALLSAVRTLREHLLLLAPREGAGGAELTDLDDQLAQVQEEITATGRTDAGRLARLRERLELGTSAAAGLASAATVAQAIGQLLG